MNFSIDATSDELKQLRLKLKQEADKVRKKKGHKTDRNEPAEPKKKEPKKSLEKRSSYSLATGIMVLIIATLLFSFLLILCINYAIFIQNIGNIFDFNIFDELMGGNPLNPIDYVFD